MAVAEQVRLATVEEHVRGENARDMDAVMRTFSDGEQASVVYNGIPIRGRAKIRRSYEIRLSALPAVYCGVFSACRSKTGSRLKPA
jgi:predicted NBD/HSP70 family sugar kinase